MRTLKTAICVTEILNEQPGYKSLFANCYKITTLGEETKQQMNSKTMPPQNSYWHDLLPFQSITYPDSTPYSTFTTLLHH